MNTFEQNRRSLLFSLGGRGISPVVPRSFGGTQPTPRPG